MSESIILKQGERAVIVGSTGSGKTQMLLTQLQMYANSPVWILDSKGDPAISAFVNAEKDNGHLVKSADQIAGLAKAKTGPDYLHILPPPAELSDPEALDEYLMRIYEAGKPCLVCVDEVYQLHSGGRAGPGLIGLLTRGRSKGISLICCTQRPSWASRFVYSESQHFFIYRLTDLRDYKTLRDMGIPYPGNKKLDKYHFFYYKSGNDDGTFFAPIPVTFDPGYAGSGIGKKWL